MGRSNSDFHFPGDCENRLPLSVLSDPQWFFLQEHYVPEFKERLLSDSAFIWKSIRLAFTTSGSTMYLARAFIAVLKTEDCMLSQSDLLFAPFLSG